MRQIGRFERIERGGFSDRITMEFEKLLKEFDNKTEQKDVSKLKAILNMIDPEHSIILNNTIGLIGDGPKNSYDGILNLINTSEKSEETLRGINFDVVTENGLLLKYKADTICILVDNGKTVGYAFGLKDKKAEIEFDSFFGLDSETQAYVFWDFDKLYINNAKDLDLKSEFIYERDFEASKLSVSFKGNKYLLRKYLANNINIYSKMQSLKTEITS